MALSDIKQWIKNLGILGTAIFKDNAGDAQIVTPLTPLPTTAFNYSNKPRHIFLTDTGDGQGTLSYIGNYSVTAKDIYYEALTAMDIHTLMFNISDDAKFLQTGYGGNGALTNGLKFFFKPSGLSEVPLFGGYAVKTNQQMLNLTQDATLTAFSGTSDTLAATIDSIAHYGMPLHMNIGDRIILRLNDDFTALTAQSFIIGGRELT